LETPTVGPGLAGFTGATLCTDRGGGLLERRADVAAPPVDTIEVSLFADNGFLARQLKLGGNA